MSPVGVEDRFLAARTLVRNTKIIPGYLQYKGHCDMAPEDEPPSARTDHAQVNYAAPGDDHADEILVFSLSLVCVARRELT